MRSPAPFFLAPIGVLSIAHEAAEVGVAQASASSGVPMVLSSAATHSLEEVAGTGAPALVPALLGERPRDLREFRAARRGRRVRRDRRHARHADARLAPARPPARIPAVPAGQGCGQFFSDPVFRSRLDKSPTMTCSPPRRRCSRRSRTSALEWNDLDWLRGQTALPILVKGVLTADDAREALAHGVDGSSSRTTAAVRSTAPSPRSTRSSRCGTRCRTQSC